MHPPNTCPTQSVYSDKVYTSSDLSRRTSEVLDEAAKAPITITRNGQSFAIVPREQAANLYKVQIAIGPSLAGAELLSTLLDFGRERPVQPDLEWILAFDLDDQRSMAQEVVHAIHEVLSGNASPESIEDVVHQWKESAIAIQSGILESAMQEPAEWADAEMPR